MGTRLGAYAPAKGKGKGKAKAKGQNEVHEVTDDDEVAFEFYHVRESKSKAIAVADVQDDVVDTGVQRVSPADAAFHSALHRRWQLHSRGRRRLGICHSVSLKKGAADE
jgi:hypothetical protein